jgi:4-diphosphocytidyl-2-C-methyl-D-erythritol kinase
VSSFRPVTVEVLAPAKVNLSLRIVGRRADGYHELDSLMFAVSLHDRLRIEAAPAARRTVSCRVSGPEKVAGGGTNLAARAAGVVLDHLGVEARVAIALRKEVPFGAGLGGGSSDAAAVLRVLPGLLGRRIPSRDLARLAVGLGADVPFFLACAPARARGIGEKLSPLAGVPRGGLVIAVPDQRVETAWAYRHALPRLTSGGAASSTRPLPRSLDAVEGWFFNHFQPGVEKAFPSVARTRKVLEEAGARATVLSGSGSAMVASFATAASAEAAAAGYEGPGRAWAVRFLRRAPRATRRS